MKPGDLVEFSGKYYYLDSGDRWMWVINSLTKMGIISEINPPKEIFILCDAKQYLVTKDDVDEGITVIVVINDAELIHATPLE